MFKKYNEFKEKFIDYMDNKHGNKKKSPKQPKSDTDNSNSKSDTKSRASKKKNHKVSQTRKLAFSTSKVQKIVSWSIIALIIISVLFNIIFFVKYNNIQSTVKSEREQVQNELNQSGNNVENKSDKAQYFTERFLKDYFTIPKEDDERNKHIDGMSKYFYKGFDVEELYNLDNFDGSREYISSEYVSKHVKSDNEVVLYYDVKYKNVSIEQEEKKETVGKGKDKKKKTVKKDVEKPSEEETQVAVTLKGKNGGYAVVDNPKLTSQKLHSDVTEEDIKQDDRNDNTLTSDSNFKSSIKEFLTAYGTSDDKLSLLSSYDKGLSNQTLVDYQILNSHQDNKNYKAKVFVTYKDKSGVESNYTYNLILSKQKDKYYIEKIEE
ncbi:Conjugative transposon protein TcpC [Staphylococcus aureus]|uniref:conjugal transfer protein n=1 Tax=Staphylococcus aureus TaxID=1280 RepID=UPI000B2FFA3A|nr:conjugal transfer protein [Staphylococcus aureus]CAC7011847.1 Conjugative transposon protein TcpC [Staphylococcus aureus]HCX2553876.1 conjugal transfer protein [Staphylococcus aureus]HCX3011884.1 conjugal transfer protein [Staphylococcus aureus]HCX3672998.1 conjugal transfer protein [Staphylococcus aureus]